MLKLLQHPGTCQGLSVEAACLRQSATTIRLDFIVLIGADIPVLPDPGPATRRNGLWHSTCFELFARRAGEPAYEEFNVAPSSAWAAYSFTGYRSGRKVNRRSRLTFCHAETSTTAYRIGAEFHSPILAGIAPGEMEYGLSAIIDCRDGSRSFWALAHPCGAPDFHHNAAFAAAL